MKSLLLALLAVVLVHQYLRWAANERPVKRVDHLDDFLADCTSEAPWLTHLKERPPNRGHKHG